MRIFLLCFIETSYFYFPLYLVFWTIGHCRGNYFVRRNFEFGNFDEHLGSKFSIQLSKESKSVTIFYKTTNTNCIPSPVSNKFIFLTIFS